MAFWIPMAIGAGAGILQSEQKRKQAEREAQFRKAAIAYSPWTGMQDPGQPTQNPGILTGALQGAGAGAMIGQSMGMGGAQPMSPEQQQANLIGDQTNANIQKDMSVIGAGGNPMDNHISVGTGMWGPQRKQMYQPSFYSPAALA